MHHFADRIGGCALYIHTFHLPSAPRRKRSPFVFCFRLFCFDFFKNSLDLLCISRRATLSPPDVANGRTFGMLSPPLHNEGPPHILHRRLIASPKLNSRIVLYCHHFPVALTAIWSHRRLRFRNGWSASPVHCGVSLFSPVSVSVSVLECAFCLLLGLPC